MRTAFDFSASTAARGAGTPSVPQAPDGLPQWRLSDLYESPDSAAVAADLKRAGAESGVFADSYQGRLSQLASGAGGGRALARAVREFEALSDLLGKLASFAYLNYAADASDPAAAKFFGDMQEKLTGIGTRLLFFPLELNRLDDRLMEAALSDPALGRYRPWIEDLRKERPYQLTDELEKLFHEKSVTGAGAWSRLFNETIASLRFDIRGEKLAIEPALACMMDPDESVRRDAADAIAQGLKENIRLFALITNTLVKDKEISDRWRGFEDAAASRHLENRVEPEVVEALVAAVRARYPRLSHRYYRLKARWMGKKRLGYWDRNAPLTAEPTRDIGWEEARRTVLEAYARFSPEMARIAGMFFTHGWIDAPVRQGKSPGAFAHPVTPSAHPYIMLNYQGKPRDVMTLAHELGHGVHQWLANAQGALMAPTPLTLAETASVFGEMLTFKSLLSASGGPAGRRTLLAQKVEDKINTVVRQTAFYDFEHRVHSERRHGELTSERLGEIWLDVQGESLGPAIHLSDGYENYWSYISHFVFSPFYVYAYAFGDCLVNSLYAVYERSQGADEKRFEEQYLEMLRAGGGKGYRELLAPFGLDPSDPQFWNMGLGVIESMIDELETL
jgi:oligoendopeptidase F